MARSAAGQFRVTFDRKYSTLFAALASLQLASADDKRIVVGPYNADNRTLDLFVADGSTFANEVQDIDFSAVPDAGAWTITFDGQTTTSLAFGANAAAVQAALEALSNIGTGNIAVSGNYTDGFTLTFQGALAGTNVAQVTVTDTLTASATPVDVTIATTTAGASTADISADANNRVNFKVYVSSIKVGSV